LSRNTRYDWRNCIVLSLSNAHTGSRAISRLDDDTCPWFLAPPTPA
jgi:hypothetical protein